MMQVCIQRGIYYCFFFFQAEDGIRDVAVTGVQTCALPIFEALALAAYRERKISAAQLRQLLGYETRMEVDAFLKNHGVELEYTLGDIERDRDTHQQLGL